MVEVKKTILSKIKYALVSMHEPRIISVIHLNPLIAKHLHFTQWTKLLVSPLLCQGLLPPDGRRQEAEVQPSQAPHSRHVFGRLAMESESKKQLMSQN